MGSLIQADLYKIFKSTSTWVVVCVAVLSAAVLAASAYYVNDGTITVETASGTLSLFTEPQMIALLGSMLAGIVLCTDFDNKQIESAVSVGHSRSSIAAGKMISLLMLTALIYLPYILVMFILPLTNLEFMNFLPTPVLNTIAEDSGFPNTLVVASTTLLLLFSQLTISILYMFLLKKPVLVIAATYMTILILGPISNLNDTLSSIMSYTPYGVGIAEFNAEVDPGFILESIVIAVVFILIIYALTWIIFRKDEVK